MASGSEFSAADVRSSTVPESQVLSNGSYTAVVTSAGTGYSSYDGIRLTRWVPDSTRDEYGFFLYVRDELTGEVWSAGLQPIRQDPESYSALLAPGRVTLRRVDHGIETTTEICVAPDADVELRRVTIRNLSGAARRLSLTTYGEVVLNTPAADAGHPAFSKLFVQTAVSADGWGVTAKRRPRSADEKPVWLEHRLWCTAGAESHTIEYETDRKVFIGRGRSLDNPRALDPGVALSGTVGDVLDPVLSLRRGVELPPGGSACFIAALAAGPTLESVGSASARYLGSPVDMESAADNAFTGAVERARGVYTELGVNDAEPPDDLRQMLLATGAAIYGDAATQPLVLAQDVVVDDRLLLRAAQDLITEGRAPPPPLHRAETANALRHSARGEVLRQARPDRERADVESLEFFNGFGGFAANGTEYVIRLGQTQDGLRWPPQPWTNVVANERLGFIASESGAGYTWSVNSRTNRLTPWSNDPVSDPHGEALYVRDEESGAFWSPMPGPAPGVGEYEVRHGFGYSCYRHMSTDLGSEVFSFVPRHDPVKITRVRLTNNGDRPRRLSLFAYAQWVLGDVPWMTAPNIATDVTDGVIRATNATNGPFAPLVAFATVVHLAPDGNVDNAQSARASTDRAAFLGKFGDLAAPAALTSRVPLDEASHGDPNSCAALQLPISIAPGETVDCAFLLGQGVDDAEVAAIVAQYRNGNEVQAALDDVRLFWRELVSGVQITTPAREIDIMVNGWLAYQNLSCRIWGRSAFYQSGGAFGFRDQLQDTAALIYLAPEQTRHQILLHAAHQFVAGDVLHWWHPPASAGIRTHFSDDLIWLPYVTSFYVETTGDTALLDETMPFVTGPPLAAGEDELFVEPAVSQETATVYEHCCRALDRSLTSGVHGLPLMGTGDWNDGMNRVGREGRGESVWLGFFLADVLEHFIPICARRGDAGRAAAYRAYLTELTARLNDAGWDGAWYRRAYYDDGTPLGTAAGDECRIDAIAQAWSVIAGVAPPARGAQALQAMEANLVSEKEGIIRLLTPAFDRTPHDPGYIKGYLPGVRENGGQYTHAALWAVKALAEFGLCERGAPLLRMLSPITHTRTPEEVAVYQVEPYVVAADVYGVAPHVGRGGWTWYTGSAGWMFRVALESVLGVEIVGGTKLLLRPCVPESWPGFTLSYRLPDGRTVYELEVRRGELHQKTIVRMDSGNDAAGVEIGTEDGVIVIPLQADGELHRVVITLGADIVSRYAQSLANRERESRSLGSDAT